MANDYFQFKQFTIYQGRCAMKVGTDGVLLGSWADLTESKHILDIGTGTGLIALMAAQRNSQAQIDAIEIDEDACRQALENVQASPWQNRINIFHGRIQDFQPEHSYEETYCISSNCYRNDRCSCSPDHESREMGNYIKESQRRRI